MTWRPAKSLVVLRNEVNLTCPGRDTTSDGLIGDTAHAATASDHNPNSAGVVCAMDITHDPAHGADMGVLFNYLYVPEHRHPALKYLIFDGRIVSARNDWAPRVYTKDPHAHHMHVSVGTGPDGGSTGDYDDTSPWGVADALSVGPSIPPEPAPGPVPEEDEMRRRLMMAKGDSTGRVYFVEAGLAWRWWIPNEKQLGNVIFTLQQDGGVILPPPTTAGVEVVTVAGAPVWVVDAEFLAAIPDNTP